MPRYDYRCGDCGEQFEVVQSFDEAPLDTCPHCGGAKPRKLFGNVGVVFKASGLKTLSGAETYNLSGAAVF